MVLLNIFGLQSAAVGACGEGVGSAEQDQRCEYGNVEQLLSCAHGDPLPSGEDFSLNQVMVISLNSMTTIGLFISFHRCDVIEASDSSSHGRKFEPGIS